MVLETPFRSPETIPEFTYHTETRMIQSDDLPTFESEITKCVPEHMKLLSFNSDDDAANFEEWWRSEGENIFTKWMNNEH